MKILIFSHGFYPAIGGIEMTAEILATGFSEKYDAEVVVVTRTPANLNSDKKFPFKVVRQPTPVQLYREVAEADVIFHNNPLMRFYWPQLIHRKPWAVVFRSYLWWPDYKYSIIQKMKLNMKYFFIKKATIMISNSKSTASLIPDSTRVIYNCYRNKLFIEKNKDLRPANSLVYLGRLSDDKGIELLLEAMSILKKRGTNTRLTLIGDGPSKQEFVDLANKLDVIEQINFVGKLHGENIVDELNKHAIAVIPSTHPETFGTVALEVAASGCVSVYSNHGGLPEAAGNTGLPFEPYNVDDLADKVEQLINDNELYQQLKNNAPEHLAKFTPEVFVKSYYDALIEAMEVKNRDK